jgi:centromere protein I
VSGVVERICSRAYDDGLTNPSLDKLIDILTQPNELDQGTLGSLIKNLYPASKVPNAIIIKVVGSLGHGRAKPSYATQVALLKWLVMVYDVLENQKVLSHFYGILFNLLDTLSIRYALFIGT